MSVPPLNPFAGMAAIGLNDRKAIQQEREQDKTQAKIEQKAIGDSEATALESATDRDADGRQNWHGSEQQSQEPAIDESGNPAPRVPRHSRDPYNERGNTLDLDG
jgi:hypothetical protein